MNLTQCYISEKYFTRHRDARGGGGGRACSTARKTITAISSLRGVIPLVVCIRKTVVHCSPAAPSLVAKHSPPPHRLLGVFIVLKPAEPKLFLRPEGHHGLLFKFFRFHLVYVFLSGQTYKFIQLRVYLLK